MNDYSTTSRDNKEEEICKVPSERLNTRGVNSLQGFTSEKEKSENDLDLKSDNIDETSSKKSQVETQVDETEIKPEQKTIIIPESGEKINVNGGVEKYKGLNHQQGEITGLEGSCGLCSAECIGNMYGVKNDQGKNLSEKDIYESAIRKTPPLCDVQSGGTSPEGQKQIIENMGLPAHLSYDTNLDALAHEVENGKAVKIGVDSSELWDQNPHDQINLFKKPDHAVTVIDTARDPTDNSLKGFFINDSNINESYNGSGRFVDVNKMFWCWQNSSGNKLVVDKKLPNK